MTLLNMLTEVEEALSGRFLCARTNVMHGWVADVLQLHMRSWPGRHACLPWAGTGDALADAWLVSMHVSKLQYHRKRRDVTVQRELAELPLLAAIRLHGHKGMAAGAQNQD